MIENNARISDEALDKAAGGAIFNSTGIIGADPNNQWEVLDDKGNVVARFNNEQQAKDEANRRGLGTWRASWATVQDMRTN